MTREEIINLIVQERESQLNHPGIEQDYLKTKNDWTSLVGYYLFENVKTEHSDVSFEEFRSSLITAGAVILAALEHSFNHEEDSSKEELKNEIMDKIKKDL